MNQCFVTAGTMWNQHARWPLYCGEAAVALDVNGRPVCKHHLGGQPAVEWKGHGHPYPHGDGDGGWIFVGPFDK